ncbi:MAG TPA: helix-turn-helix transcriptional regulator [Polyangiaceae bacterium]|nr:helix-turn-helix transcriptional regulator [Polyangiaceae bacterium]
MGFPAESMELEAPYASDRAGLGELARYAAVRGDLTASSEMDLGLVWSNLSSGHFRVVDWFFTKSRTFMVLETLERRERRLTKRKLEVLERILLRGGQKAVAVELNLAPSTVAIIAGNCLRTLGIDSGASRAPVLLSAAVHAFHGRTPLGRGQKSLLSHSGRTYQVISMARPEAWLVNELSPAEFAVTRLLVEGHSHAEMAALRHTSVRTIANQLAAAFHKLGVSGRCELLCRTLRASFEATAWPPPGSSPGDRLAAAAGDSVRLETA